MIRKSRGLRSHGPDGSLHRSTSRESFPSCPESFSPRHDVAAEAQVDLGAGIRIAGSRQAGVKFQRRMTGMSRSRARIPIEAG